MRARPRDAFWHDRNLRVHAHENFLSSEWLRQQAERRGLPALPTRPWLTLAERVLVAAGLGHIA